MPKLVPFDEIEAIILLNVCQFIITCDLTKNSMLLCLSKVLRKLARNKGYDIDNSYRSTSGLNYQTNVMFNHISGSGKNRIPHIFQIASDLYEHDNNEFIRKLWEGLLVASENKKQAFLRFLTARKPQSASDIFWALEKAEEYLKSSGILSGSMYESLSLGSIQRFESIIYKDSVFAKKYKGMVYYLKIGFSVIKEFVADDVTTNKNQIEINSDAKISNIDILKHGSLTDHKNTAVNGSVDFELKTETLEKHYINADSIPVSFVYYTRTVEGIESWTDLYVKFMKIFWTEKGRQLSIYIGRSFVDEQSVDIGDINTTKRMRKPKRIADSVFVEIDLNYKEIINRIKAVLDKTAIPYKRFSITYKQPVKKKQITPMPKVTSSLETSLKSQSVQAINDPLIATQNTSDKLSAIPITKHDTTTSKIVEQECKIDFYKRQDMAYTKPVNCYCDEIRINTARNWIDLYTKLFCSLWKKYRRNLSYYIGINLVNGSRIDIGNKAMSYHMKAPKLIEKDEKGNSIYLETNLSANNIVGRIQCILEICHIPLTDVEITYIKRTDAPQVVSKTIITPEPAKTALSSTDFIEWLVKKYNLSKITARNYYSSVRRAEELAKKLGLSSYRLLNADNYDEAQATYSELLKNSMFIKMNEVAHNGFTAAINKFLQYLLSDGIKSGVSRTFRNKPRYDKDLTERCLAVLRESFSNGIKRDAEIAKRKFRNAYFGKYDSYLPDEIDLDDLFQENALEYDGKFYATSKELITFIQERLQAYPKESGILFFYDTFYDKNITQFSQYGVYSANMMRAVMEKEFPDYYYKANCFSSHRGLTLEQVVNVAYGEDICLTISKLQERLPYIGELQLLPLLSRSNSGFVRISDSTYAKESRIHIAKSDIEKSQKIIEDDISKQGYSFIKSIIVEESEVQNPEIPEQALQLVLFDRYLADHFSRKRNLISPLGESDSIADVIKNFCIQHKKITLKEVEEYEMEFTGENTSRRSLRVVAEVMIRVSDDTFVDHVDYDVAAIDKAIAPFFNNKKVITLKNVTSFSVFPDVDGYAWNSYLLSSYLRRYSKQWGYIGEEHKKKSVGAIFDKSLAFDSYDDAMALAVADSGIELTQEEVSFFLLNNEYRLRDADFKDIISKAYQIRMREE